MKKISFTILFFILLGSFLHAQDSSRLDRLVSFPGKLFGAVDKKARAAGQQFDKVTAKYLDKLQKREEKLKRKLWKKDSALAKELFGDVRKRYDRLRQTVPDTGRYHNVYSPRLDSLSASLNFINGEGLAAGPEVQKTLASLKSVQGKLNATEQIRKQIQARQQLLKEKFNELGLVKELKKFRQEVYYYQAQVAEYKQLWEDPSKLERKLLDLAMKVPQFREFFSRHSQLSSLFSLPGGNNSGAPLSGLQTRASLQQNMADRFGSGGDVVQVLQQNVQAAQSQLNGLKARAQGLTSGSVGSAGELDLPQGFKPNGQKTKSFLQRLEIGTNFQTQKARYYFPVTADLALSVGYKLNDKSIVGVGLAYKAGLGKSWSQVAISHQGLGLRSFIDYRMKGSFYLTGGYEQNYLSQFNRIDQLKEYAQWQVSGVLGLSKKYQLRKKLKGEIKLLWDFMSYAQVPQTQPILVRVGYAFK